MLQFILALLIGVLLVGRLWAVVRARLLPPVWHPSNIPTIPFYYTLLPLFLHVDQEDLYHRYLKEPLAKSGAVNIFFGGHWNVLVTAPSYMAHILKQDQTFPKAGNHVKNPNSVLALYTGENIISSVDDKWKLFAAVMKPGLQSAVDPGPILKNAERLIDLVSRDQSQTGGVAMQDHVQAFAINNVTESLLGFEIEALGNPDACILQLQRTIKPKIFNPFHLNFPMLDRLNLPGRAEAKRAVLAFNEDLADLLLQGHEPGHCTSDAPNLGCRLVAAYREGLLTREQFRQNCVITFIAGHENPQCLLLSSLLVICENTELQQRLREELMGLSYQDRRDADKLSGLPLLTATMFETLRLYPPLSQIMNKRTQADAVLGEIALQPGTFTGYNGYCTNRNREFWGPDADEFAPERWGSTLEEATALYRRATSKAALITFHGGKRACLGQKWALAAHRLTMSVLLTSGRWRLHPTWERKMTPAGPLMPKNLKVVFTRTDGADKWIHPRAAPGLESDGQR